MKHVRAFNSGSRLDPDWRFLWRHDVGAVNFRSNDTVFWTHLFRYHSDDYWKILVCQNESWNWTGMGNCRGTRLRLASIWISLWRVLLFLFITLICLAFFTLEIVCPPIPTVEHSEYIKVTGVVGPKVTYSCLKGFMFPDKSKAKTILCLHSGHWSAHPENCQSKQDFYRVLLHVSA